MKYQAVVFDLSESVVIHPMCIEDYQEVADLWKRTDGVGLDDDADSKCGVERYLYRNPGMSFVARSTGNIVGAVLCGHDGRRGYLHHLAVDGSYRHKGIGRALTECCINALRDAGINKCNIMVYSHNDIGQEFWRITGWSSRNDLLLMQKYTCSDAPCGINGRKEIL